MKIIFSDIELKLLLQTGKSRKYRCLQRRTGILCRLTFIYNTLYNINKFEDIKRFKSISITEEGSGIIPVDGSNNIKMIFLLQGDIINILSLKISETETNNE